MAAVLAVIPVFIIIIGGYLCRRFRFPDDGFWRGAEKITYFVLFPCLLISKMAAANLANIVFFKPLVVILLLFLCVSVLFIVVRPFLHFNNAAFTSVYQGGIRFNTYIGLALAQSLYGTDGLVIAVILASIMIPVINVCCVLVLEYYNHQSTGNTPKRILKSLITNPLILACVIGMGVNIANIPVPAVILEALNIFSRAALPLGLLTVGAALTLNAISSAIKPLVIASVAKFLLMPAIAMGLCRLLDVEPNIRNALLILTVLPTATASYVLARQLRGDYELMATIITFQTLLSAIAIPMVLMIFS